MVLEPCRTSQMYHLVSRRAQFWDLYSSCRTSTTSTKTFNRVSASLQMISLFIAKYIQTLFIKFFKQTYFNLRNGQTDDKCSLIYQNVCTFQLQTKLNQSHTSIRYFGYPLSKLASHSYLGVKFDSKLSWAKHITEIKSKSTKVLGMVKITLGPCKPEVKDIAYNMLVRPKIDHASSIWNPHTSFQINHLEKM